MHARERYPGSNGGGRGRAEGREVKESQGISHPTQTLRKQYITLFYLHVKLAFNLVEYTTLYNLS